MRQSDILDFLKTQRGYTPTPYIAEKFKTNPKILADKLKALAKFKFIKRKEAMYNNRRCYSWKVI